MNIHSSQASSTNLARQTAFSASNQTADPISPAAIRRSIIEQSYRAHVGHIGSALSIVELLCAVYGGILRIADATQNSRDRFVLSKGHAALALYAILHERGLIDSCQLDTYCSNHSLLGSHPEYELPGIEFTTGSLGQGLSFGVGAALAAKHQHCSRRAFVLISDAECNEGAVWESAMFAAHHRLDNLIVIVDDNGQQAFGYTRDVLDLCPLENRWQAFGFNVKSVDGHDVEAISMALTQCFEEPGKPHAIVAHTTFGKGISFMQGQIKWHYYPLDDEQYKTALNELEAQP